MANLNKKVSAVVNGIFIVSSEEGKKLRQITLQKYLYLSCAYWYTKTKEWPLEARDNFEAWYHGPVLPSVYDEYEYVGDDFIPAEIIPNADTLPASLTYTIKEVVRKYKHYQDFSLSGKMHAEDTPWSKVYKLGTKKVIPRKTIRDHFLESNLVNKIEIVPLDRNNFKNLDYSDSVKKLELLKEKHPFQYKST